MRLGITAKLMGAFTVAIIPFFFVTGIGHYSLVSISRDTETFATDIEQLSIINQLTLRITQSIHPIHNYLSSGNKSEIQRYYIKFNMIQSALKNLKNLKHFHFGNRDKKGDEYDYYSDIKKKLIDFNLLNKKILKLDRLNNSVMAIKLMKRQGFLVESILNILDIYLEVHKKELQDMKKFAVISQTRTYNSLIVSWSGSIVFCIIIVFLVSRYFSNSILAIDAAAKSIGAGNLDQRVNVTSNDELGEMVRTFNDMAEKLQKTTVSKDYFDNILQSMNEVLIVLSLDRKIQSVNEAATMLLGYNKDEIIGHDIDVVFPEEHPLRDKKIMGKINKGQIIHAESMCVSKDGKNIPMMFSISIMQNDPGSMQGIVCVAQDIRFRKRAEEEIKYLSQQLIRIQEDERARISREIHDNLGGSLLALKINIHSLFTKAIDSDEKNKNEYNELMNYLKGIIESSRLISKNLSPVGLKAVGLQRAINELANRLNKNKKMNVKINLFQLDDFFPDNWDVNIYRIIQEGLTNIVKHSDATDVSILSKITKNKLTISIKDNGKGIDFSNLRLIDSGDLGLGLLIMRERTGLLGGKFDVISGKGKGTEVKIEIPKKK